jgi:hypothetical protein
MGTLYNCRAANTPLQHCIPEHQYLSSLTAIPIPLTALLLLLTLAW